MSEFQILERLRDEIFNDPDLAARVSESMRGIRAQDPFPTPLNPPIEWFAPMGGIGSGTKMVVEPNGRVYGRFFEWGTCVIGFSTPGRCVTPFPSPDGYLLYHQSDTQVTLENGELVQIPTGMIAYGHAELGDPDDPTPSQTIIDHYNDPQRALVTARAYEDDLGGYIVGAMLPGSTHADAAIARASALSGHWGYVEGFTTAAGTQIRSGIHNFGPSAVVRPGAPLVRDTTLVTASLGAGGHQHYLGALKVMTPEDLQIPGQLQIGGTETAACGCSKPPVEPVTASIAGTADDSARRLDRLENTQNEILSIVTDLLNSLQDETPATIEEAAARN